MLARVHFALTTVMSKPSELSLLDDHLQQHVILPNVLYKSPVWFHRLYQLWYVSIYSGHRMHLEQYVHSAPVSPTWPSKGNLVISQSCRHLANLTYCTESLMHRKFATQWRSHGGNAPPPTFGECFFSNLFTLLNDR